MKEYENKYEYALAHHNDLSIEKLDSLLEELDKRIGCIETLNKISWAEYEDDYWTWMDSLIIYRAFLAKFTSARKYGILTEDDISTINIAGISLDEAKHNIRKCINKLREEF